MVIVNQPYYMILYMIILQLFYMTVHKIVETVLAPKRVAFAIVRTVEQNTIDMNCMIAETHLD